jgi:hypothetical protein
MSANQPPLTGSGLERLLLAASADPALADRLCDDPLAAARERGVVLGPTERALLKAMAPARLRSMVQAMATSGVRPPEERLVDWVSLGIREDTPPVGLPVATGVRPDLPPEREILFTGMRADEPAPIRGIRPGRRVVIAAAAAGAVAALGVGAAVLLSAGSRPHRPARTPPLTPPDAGAADAAPDAGRGRLKSGR